MNKEQQVDRAGIAYSKKNRLCGFAVRPHSWHTKPNNTVHSLLPYQFAKEVPDLQNGEEPKEHLLMPL